MSIETFNSTKKLEGSQDGRDQTLKTSEKNKEENSNINDAEFEEMSTEMKDEIEKMKPAEKKTFLDGIANMGYKISEIKNNTFRGIYSSLSQMSTKSDFLHRYFNSYAGIYDKESKKAKQKKEQIGKGIIATGSGLGQGAGTLFKYGRVLYDAKDHIGGGLQRLNPFRHITAAAMFVGRSAEAGKEMRFEYDSVKEKTRVKDEEKAMEEALNIYEKVYGKEGLEKFKKGEKASESIYNEKGEIDRKKEEEQKVKFEKAYKNNLPEDIKNRLSKMDFPLTKWYKIYFDKSKDTKVYIDRLIKKIDKIENNKKLNNKEKENKKQALLKSKEALLTDLDKMVGDDGTVDSISYYSRMAEKVSKGVATALIIDSVGRIAKAGWELRHLLDRFDNDNVTLEQDFELSETDKKVMESLENLSEEDKKYISENGLSKYMENKEQKQFNDTLDSIDRTKIETDKAVTVDNTADKTLTNKLENDKVNTNIKENEKLSEIEQGKKVFILVNDSDKKLKLKLGDPIRTKDGIYNFIGLDKNGEALFKDKKGKVFITKEFYVQDAGKQAGELLKDNNTLNSIDRTKIETDKAVTDNNTANKLPVDKSVNNKVNTRGVGIKEIEKVYNPVKVEIKGKINRLSEAVSKALHSESTTADVKDNFIHKWSGDDINIDENNRDELLNQAIRKMSVANIDNDPNNNVLNLIHKGDIVSIDEHGNIKINTESGSGIEAKAVSELQLRENWADIEGAKHGFKPKEVSFGGDENNLGKRSYDVDVNGAKVNIDSDGNFKAIVEGEKVSGDISDLKGGETAKDFISEKINNAKVEIEATEIRTKGIAEFEKIIGKSELTQNNAD